MVLWEITVLTAYFLGLKRTYKLALKIQRRLISPNYPKIRAFAHRRTRGAFDMALTVHRKIQQRDLEVGRNLGNWILRWLDRMKPSAEIRNPRAGNFSPKRNLKANNRKQPIISPQDKTQGGSQNFSTYRNGDSNKRLFSLSKFPGITMTTRPTIGSLIQNRRMSFMGPEDIRLHNIFRIGHNGVIRKDIMEWMLQK